MIFPPRQPPSVHEGRLGLLPGRKDARQPTELDPPDPAPRPRPAPPIPLAAGGILFCSAARVAARTFASALTLADIVAFRRSLRYSAISACMSASTYVRNCLSCFFSAARVRMSASEKGVDSGSPRASARPMMLWSRSSSRLETSWRTSTCSSETGPPARSSSTSINRAVPNHK